MFELVWPWIWLLLPLPLLVWWLTERTAQQKALKAPLYLYWKNLQESEAKSKTQFPWLTFLLWLLILFAASRPQWVGEAIDIPASGRDLLVSIDVSGSMEMKDMVIADQPVDRLVAVKAIMTDFIKRRQGDRVGLILFGENAYLQTPLTFDLKTVQSMLDESEIGLAGPSATAIGDSIGLAVKRLKDRNESNRVLILLTDGVSNAGVLNPLQAAELAEHAGVTVYTIGIGADEIVSNNGFIRRRFNPSRELDEETLTRVAQLTGGQYFRARDTKELKAIYDTLELLEPIEDKAQTYRPIKALFYIPLLIALFISFLSNLISLLSSRKLAKSISTSKAAQNSQVSTNKEFNNV